MTDRGPSIMFNPRMNTGIYWSGEGVINVVVAGSNVADNPPAPGSREDELLKMVTELGDRLHTANQRVREFESAEMFAEANSGAPYTDDKDVRQIVEIVTEQIIGKTELRMGQPEPSALYQRVVDKFTDLMMSYHRAFLKNRAQIAEYEEALRLGDAGHREAKQQHMAWYQRAETLQAAIAPVVDLYIAEVSRRARCSARQERPGPWDVPVQMYSLMGDLSDTVAILGALPIPTYESFTRDRRQKLILAWAERTFHDSGRADPLERACRFIEEALELFDAVYHQAGGNWEHMDTVLPKIIARVRNRPPGDVFQEFGQVGVTVNCLAELLGVSFATAEIREFERVQLIPRDVFLARHATKGDVAP